MISLFISDTQHESTEWGRLVSVLKRQKGASVLLCFCDNGFATKTDTGEGASDSSCIESQQE